MRERIHEALDGEIAEHELTAAERAGRDELAQLISGVVRSVPVRPLPDLGAAVVQRLVAEETAPGPGPSRLARLFAWFWAPRAVLLEWRPAYGALVLVAAVGLGSVGRQPDLVPTEPAGPVLVQFRLDAPQAQSVSLAGDFTGWQPAHTLTRAGGTWTVVVALDPGVHDYAFIVDGERWVPDPMAPAVEDGFGGMNSRVAVLTVSS